MYVLKEKLVQAVARSRYSPAQIAQRTGVDHIVLARWVSGQNEVPLEDIDSLAKAIGTSREALTGSPVEPSLHWRVAEERVADLTRADLFGAVSEADRIIAQEQRQHPMRRSHVTFGADGMPMLPPNRPAVRCSCGKTVSPR